MDGALGGRRMANPAAEINLSETAFPPPARDGWSLCSLTPAVVLPSRTLQTVGGMISRMPLLNCPDCKTEVSSAAISCPKCGRPFASSAAADAGKKLWFGRIVYCVVFVAAILAAIYFKDQGSADGVVVARCVAALAVILLIANIIASIIASVRNRQRSG